MKTARSAILKHLLPAALLLLLCLTTAAFAACSGHDVPADSGTEASAQTDPASEPASLPDTDAPTEPATDPTAEPETETEPDTQAQGWHPETGVFNAGRVDYEPTFDGDGQIVSVKASPVGGNELGLDITDKKDLVGICYSVWFDAILGHAEGRVDHWYNVEEALAGVSAWGPPNAFHYWSKPALGYYRSSD